MRPTAVIGILPQLPASADGAQSVCLVMPHVMCRITGKKASLQTPHLSDDSQSYTSYAKLSSVQSQIVISSINISFSCSVLK